MGRRGHWLGVLGGMVCAHVPISAAAQVVAFVDVSVIPMDSERVLQNQTVLIHDQRIVAVGPATAVVVPPDARRIDGHGKFLMPGLNEMHAHIPVGRPTAFRTHLMALFLAGGVTTIRGMHGSVEQLALRDSIARGDLVGPTIFASSPPLTGSDAPEIARRVAAYKSAGYDHLKILWLSATAFDSAATAAHRHDIPFGGHIAVDVGLERSLAAGYSTIEHLDGYPAALAGLAPGREAGLYGYELTDAVDPARLDTIVRKTREAGSAVVPTFTLAATVFDLQPLDELEQQPGMEFLPRRTVQSWKEWTQRLRDTFDLSNAQAHLRLRERLIRELYRAGVPILLGTDAPQRMNVPGFSVHHELALYVRAGLTPFEALGTATTAPARHLHVEAQVGTVAPGKRADLLLLEANPLENIANVSRLVGVMARGHYRTVGELRTELSRYPR